MGYRSGVTGFRSVAVTLTSRLPAALCRIFWTLHQKELSKRRAISWLSFARWRRFTNKPFALKRRIGIEIAKEGVARSPIEWKECRKPLKRDRWTLPWRIAVLCLDGLRAWSRDRAWSCPCRKSYESHRFNIHFSVRQKRECWTLLGHWLPATWYCSVVAVTLSVLERRLLIFPSLLCSCEGFIWVRAAVRATRSPCSLTETTVFCAFLCLFVNTQKICL